MPQEKQFTSNNCVAVCISDLNKAKEFYGGVMGFKLVEENESQLLFDTGHFKLYVDKQNESHPPVPSFTVGDFAKAKVLLENNGCTIIKGGKNWMWFKDPFGNVFDAVQE